jgi:hypothetical protein
VVEAGSGSPTFEVFLVVESRRPASELAEYLTLEPTTIREYHSPIRRETVSEWSLRIAAGNGTFAVLAAAEDALLGIEPGTRERLNAVGREEGTRSTFLIVQRATDDPLTKGIELSPRMVAWLADAGATVSIDQYFYPAGSEDDLPPAE